MSRSTASRVVTWFGIAAAAMGGAVLVAMAWGDRPSDVMREPAQRGSYEPFYGLVTNLGVFAFLSCAVLAWFAASVGRRRDPSVAGLLLAIGTLSLVLAFDDLLVLHESLIPKRTPIPEMAVVLSYGVAALAIAVGFRAAIARTELALLGAGAACFATSVVVDFALHDVGHGVDVFVEDGAKFFGTVLLLGYVWSTASTLLAPSADTGSSVRAPAAHV